MEVGRVGRTLRAGIGARSARAVRRVLPRRSAEIGESFMSTAGALRHPG